MKTKSESLRAADFFEKLQQDKLDTTVPFSIVGMVKKSEGKVKTIEFAPGGNCSNWVTIPLEFIENIEIIKTISCKDHSHPLVKLNMKTPKTPEGKIFFALLERVPTGHDLFDIGNPDNGIEPTAPTSMARLRPRFGGFRSGLENSTCMITWVDEWVCTTVGNKTTCGWVGSWKCI